MKKKTNHHCLEVVVIDKKKALGRTDIQIIILNK